MSSLRQMLVNKFSMHPLQMRQATLNDSKLARRPAFICDPGLAKDIVHELGDLSGKSVLELNPGPGVTTRALLEGPVQRVDAVEPFVKFYPGIKELESTFPGRLSLHKGDFHKVDLEEGCPPSTEILANVPRADWTADNCPLTIFGTPPVKYGLRFILSWLYKIPNRDGPFQWGRPDSYLIYPAYYANRILAQPGSPEYARVAVLAQVFLDVSVVRVFPRVRFDPVVPWSSDIVDMHLLKIKPKLHHEMTAEKLLFLDYILRLLINSKFKPLASSLKTLGPGGDELLGLANLDPNLQSTTMTPDDYLRLANAFAVWPSRPTNVTFYADLD